MPTCRPACPVCVTCFSPWRGSVTDYSRVRLGRLTSDYIIQGRKMHLTTGQYQFYALVAGSPAAIICQFNNETQWRWFVLSQSQTSVFLSFVRLDLRVRPGAQIRFQPLLYFVYSGLTFNTLSAPARIPCCVWCLNCLCALVQLMEAKRWNRLWTFFLLTTAGHSFLPPLSLFSLNGRYPNALKTDLHWFNIPVLSFYYGKRLLSLIRNC